MHQQPAMRSNQRSPQPQRRANIAATKPAVTPGAINAAELITALARVLADHTPPAITVEGVVTNWRFQKGWGSGDLSAHGPDSKIVAKIPFGIPRAGMPPDTVRNDMVIAITGRLEPSPPWHAIRLQGQRLQIVAVTSSVAVGRTTLLETLTADGRIDLQKRLTLPSAANSVGLITAAGSAARADIIGTLAATKTPVRIVEEHVAFTGTTATEQIVRAVTKLGQIGVDVLIVARGGGAQTDLEVFDGPDVANAIATCPIPVITAIGHATNLTIADQVAHTNVVTPTAAAVLITAGHQRQQQLAKDHATNTRLREAAQQAEAARRQAERAVAHRRALLIALVITLAIAVAIGAYALLR
jgi:exodeoxyribonuclease VII large subunit